MEAFNTASTLPLEEIPPIGYAVDTPALEKGEGDQPFACPHMSCDGFTFETIQECRIHEDDWHNPPYFCSECDARFAARPALKRHFKASGHFNWICLEEDCDMKGVLFANQSEFVAHAKSTAGHEHLFPDEPINSPVSVKRINYAEVANLREGETTDECSSEEEGQACPEPACRKYQQVFHTESEFARHKESHNHVNAIKYSEALRESGKSITEIMNEEEAAREFRCTAEGCSYFGQKLKTSQSFHRHIQTAQHLNPTKPCASNPASPTTDIRMKLGKLKLKLSCDEPECPKYEHRFNSTKSFNKHLGSVIHLTSVKYGHMVRSAANSASGGQGSVKTQTPEKEEPVTVAAPPSTPQMWTRSSFTPITPKSIDFTRAPVTQLITPTKRPVPGFALMTPPSSSWREENLRKRNRELEDEIEQMKGKMDQIRRTYQEQISSLFQTLGDMQDRNHR